VDIVKTLLGTYAATISAIATLSTVVGGAIWIILRREFRAVEDGTKEIAFWEAWIRAQELTSLSDEELARVRLTAREQLDEVKRRVLDAREPMLIRRLFFAYAPPTKLPRKQKVAAWIGRAFFWLFGFLLFVAFLHAFRTWNEVQHPHGPPAPPTHLQGAVATVHPGEGAGPRGPSAFLVETVVETMSVMVIAVSIMVLFALAVRTSERKPVSRGKDQSG
jgi:hypothetical protein